MDKLNIDNIRAYFKDKDIFRTEDIIIFYRQIEKEIKLTTINWRVYELIHKGVLQRIGRGKFTLGQSKNYVPEISVKMKEIFTKTQRTFPYLKICIWNTSVLNEFMIHQSNKFYYLVEVEKEAMESVFYFLRDINYSVFYDPKYDILEKYSPQKKDIIIVKSLVSEAPLLDIRGITTASIEKILVDVFCDDTIFLPQQGAEMQTIFKEAFNKYTINQNRMLRYVDRRRKKKSFSNFINSVININL